MSDLGNQRYLLSDQYKDATNLNARIQLHLRFGTNPGDWQRWVFEQFDIAAGSHILELGCGPGHLWQKNLDHVPLDWQITLTDFSEGMLQEAKNNLAGSRQHFSFQIADIQSIPFEANAFDCIIANHMLYHVPDRPRAFSEIRRVLKSEGGFYAVTNGDTHLQEVRELARRAGFTAAGMIRIGESPFSLENGAEQMAPWFSHVDIRRWGDSLNVTESEPLIAFILSNVPRSSVDEEKLRSLQTIIDRELAQHGAIAITKNTGMFVVHGSKQ